MSVEPTYAAPGMTLTRHRVLTASESRHHPLSTAPSRKSLSPPAPSSCTWSLVSRRLLIGTPIPTPAPTHPHPPARRASHLVMTNNPSLSCVYAAGPAPKSKASGKSKSSGKSKKSGKSNKNNAGKGGEKMPSAAAKYVRGPANTAKVRVFLPFCASGTLSRCERIHGLLVQTNTPFCSL